VYVRLPKVQRDESCTQGLDRLELIRFLQVAQTIRVHHGALAYLLGINALRASELAAVRIEDSAESLRGHRVLRLVGEGNKPATMPRSPHSLRHAAITDALDAGCRCATHRSSPATPTSGPPGTTTALAATSTGTRSTSSPRTSQAFDAVGCRFHHKAPQLWP
jgi:hypothetical protein